MKIYKLKIMKILVAIIFVFSFNSISAQSTLIQDELQKIIGTWVIDNEGTNKWIFTSNNICKWELDGVILDEFTYSISSEFSTSGGEHTYLKLININDSNEIYEYAINSIGNNKMTLETFNPKVSYTHFTKQ